MARGTLRRGASLANQDYGSVSDSPGYGEQGQESQGNPWDYALQSFPGMGGMGEALPGFNDQPSDQWNDPTAGWIGGYGGLGNVSMNVDDNVQGYGTINNTGTGGILNLPENPPVVPPQGGWEGMGEMPQQGNQGWMPTWQARQPSYQQGLDDWLYGSYLTKPTQMAGQLNDAIGGQLNANADRTNAQNMLGAQLAAQQQMENNRLTAQQNMLNSLLGTVGNIGSGGNRMQGFQDTRSGQSAALPGAGNIGHTQNSITAGALPQSQIALNVATAGGSGNYTAPQAPGGMKAGVQAALDRSYNTSMQNTGNRNATALDRTAGAQNAQLGRTSQVAAANQGIQNAGFLTGLNSQNAGNDMTRRNNMLRIGGRIAGMA